MKAGALAFLIRLVTGVRLDPRQVPSDGGRRIYYANHASHLDFVVIWAALPDAARRRVRPVAAAEYWESGPLRRWLARRLFQAVLIPRDPAKMRACPPLERMGEALEAGSDLIVFPEGTRSETGRLGSFKPGLFHLATRHPGVILVPVYLENLNRILPKGEAMPVPLMGNVLFGDPLAAPADDEPKAAFLDRARAAILALAHGTLESEPEDP